MEYDLNYELIGMRIKRLRLKRKLTQEVLSEKVDIGVQHLSKIENGKAKLSLACLVATANALGTTADHLLMDNVVAESTTYLTGEIKVILDDCTPEEMYLIAELAKTLKKGVRTKNLKPAENS